MAKKKQINTNFRFWWRILILLMISFAVLISPRQLEAPDAILNFPIIPPVRTTELENFSISSYPQKTGTEDFPVVTAKAFYLMDLDSGTEMFSKDPNEKLRPASITKLMTALVALDYYKPENVLTVKRLAPENGESDMGLAVGDVLNIHNLLYGLLIPSGNDAAYTIADNYPGGIENFIYAMNNKAKELHMENTHFRNPSGLDSDGHYSTAKDIALLTSAALKDQLISKIVATYGITLTDISGKKTYPMRNVNQFLGYLFGADGVKTGYTSLAGECLVSSITRNGHRLILVVLKSNDRFGDSARLLEWAFRNFDWVNVNLRNDY